jgi:hypothetical protein
MSLPQQPRDRFPPIHHTKMIHRAGRMFQVLADAGTERDKAGNRKLLYSHYASLVLLSYFNPAMQTIRGLQQASELHKVQQRLGVRRTSLGSLSESTRIFDSTLLVPLVQELLAKHTPAGPGPHRTIPEGIPNDLVRRLLAVDGSTLTALPQIVVAKMHLQFHVLTGMPAQVAVTPDTHDERDVLSESLQPDRMYIADRGFERYALDNRIVAAKSDYLIRGQARPARVHETRPLSTEAVNARITEDAIVQLNIGDRRHNTAIVDHPIRRITITKRSRGVPRASRPHTNDTVILYTNRLDLPAEMIAAIYELRWSIELFFRFLKHLLGLKHLKSLKEDAAAIHVYIAIIAGLMMAQLTGGRVTQSHYRIIQFYLSGWASDDELLAGLEKLKPKNTS